MKANRTRPLNWAAASLVTCLLGGPMATTSQAQLGGLGVTIGGSSSTGANTSSSTSYRGRATVATGVVLGTGVSVSDTGSLDSGGGARETSALQANLQGMVAAEACHAVTIGQDNMTYSEASVGQAGVNTCMTVLIGGNVISADFVMARALVSCCTNASLSGNSEIAGLTVNGQAIFVTGQPNQTVDLGNGDRIVINEQIASQTDTTADITVNALHIALCGTADVVISSAFAGITCGSTTTGGTPPGSQPPECDFVTGGGWITGTPSGAKANFGVAGGIKNGAFWGHLNYIDHGSGMHVKATAVTGYAVDPNDSDCRIIDYNVTIDGQGGTGRVRVCDKGEPGRNDIFQIQLSNGYFAGGDLGGSRPGGGNIQLHKCH